MSNKLFSEDNLQACSTAFEKFFVADFSSYWLSIVK
jgi:hypothetical protein